jgi:predicted DNA binding CopG/RHH family protein
MKKNKLDKFERDIESRITDYVPVAGKKRKGIEDILAKSRKTKNINIRIRAHDLEKLREKSSQEGLPYQTLIAQVLHKYINNRLIDEKDILKAIELLRKVETSEGK